MGQKEELDEGESSLGVSSGRGKLGCGEGRLAHWLEWDQVDNALQSWLRMRLNVCGFCVCCMALGAYHNLALSITAQREWERILSRPSFIPRSALASSVGGPVPVLDHLGNVVWPAAFAYVSLSAFRQLFGVAEVAEMLCRID